METKRSANSEKLQYKGHAGQPGGEDNGQHGMKEAGRGPCMQSFLFTELARGVV